MSTQYEGQMPTSGQINYEAERPASLRGEAQAPQEPKQQNRIRTIMLRQLDHGYIVEVGCQTFALESKHKLITLLNEYLNDPLETERKHNEGKLFV